MGVKYISFQILDVHVLVNFCATTRVVDAVDDEVKG
jgi:hypothetical protein